MNPHHGHSCVIIPVGDFAPGAQAGFLPPLGQRWSSPNEVEGDFPQNGQVLRGVVLVNPAGIFPEIDVEHPMQAIFNGLITNDKFCLSRFIRLTLTSSRYDWRQHRTAQHSECPSAEIDFCGGRHETSMARSPADDPVAGRPATLGPGLPAATRMESDSGGSSASTGKGDA